MNQLLKRLVDKDEGDEHGEALLGKTCDVADQGAEVKHNHQQQGDSYPDTDPKAEP